MCGRYASFLPAEFIGRLFATVNPLPNLAPTWNMAPTMDAPVVRLIDGDRHLDALKWGLVPYLHEGSEEGAQADQRPLGERRQVGSVQSGLRRPALPCARSGLLRMAGRSRWQDAVRRGTHRWRAGRLRGHLGKVEIPGGGDPPDVCDHHHGCEPAARRNTGPHAGYYRAEGLAARLGETEGDPASLLRPAPEDVLRIWPVGKAVGNFRNDGPALLKPSTITEPTLP